MNCYPMLVVRDVPASSRWYSELLGATSGHGGDEFEMIMSGHQLLLALHHTDLGEHPGLAAPTEGHAGTGVLLYFSVDDVDEAFERATVMGADVLDEPHMNPKAGALEFSVRDPDGYALTISKRSG